MSKEVFQPVRGTEASILSQVHRSGYLYFATDTKRIFYDDGTNFLPMGGNSGVWYGNMEYAETPEEGQVYFTFVPDQIEGNEGVEDGNYSLPNVNDLIFNMPDGCFYKVTEVDKESESPLITGLKLTVSGGGGSGGGSGGGQSGVGTMTVSRLGSSILNTLQGNSCFIRYRYTAKDAAGEETGSGIAELRVGGVSKGTYIAQQGDNEIDVGPFLEIGKNNIQLVVTGSIGGTSSAPPQTKNWTVYSTNLSFTWDYDETTINRADDIILNWRVSTTAAHTMHIVIDDLQIIDVESTTASQDKTFVLNRSSYGLFHGSHKVTLYASAEIGGDTFNSASISHQIICVDANRGDTIISVSLTQNELNQYDTLSIPIILYDPTSIDGKVSATLREDGADKDNWIDYENGVQYYWNYTPITTGTKVLSIVSGTAEKVLHLTVNDLGLSAVEVPGYEFKFKASDLISNNALQNWSYGTIVPSFSEDFDWINGGVKSELDENGNPRNYVSIKAGNKLSFNYTPFFDDKRSNGFCFKIIFKANECRQYDANILNIGSAETDNTYLQLTANEGIFKPNGGDIIRVPYCEDSYIELEFDIYPWGSGATPYIITWLDGVPAGATTYTSTTTFFQNPAKEIVIGSDDCDVQLYMIKVYQKHLTNEQHLTNFIMDAPNAKEIVARYNRNNILDDNGEISYSKLIEKNPNCDVYLYEIPRMTLNKKDFVEGCSYRRYKGDTSPLQTAENVTISVQGTSSAAYGLAAFNIDSNFTEGFTDYSKNSSGEHIDNWAMNDKAMPVNYFNTKVNVASCEGANNALNQEWYDRYVPYVTEYHAKCAADPEITYSPRNTVEFGNMGVMFVKDNNQTVNAVNGVENNVFKEIAGYTNNPYYKLYAICNMGNSKKNKAVFTDPDNKYDVIMEVSDNQMKQQQMTSIEGLNYGNTGEAFEIGDSTVFEWRNKPKSSMMVQANDAWLDLVKWFADNNPSAATNEELDEPETYTAYTFHGYTSAVSGYTPAVQVLAGKGVNNGAVTISRYAGTYTHDTYNRRVAKMLNECEDHLIMDAMVFHYLFIERHTLIDNVAKNTFWHTEDLQHWSMIKDYDNDTSDGNDNSGNLNLTYGYEVLDHVDHDENKSFVFNASESVWLHFINELLEARTTMYQYLDNVVTDRDETSVHGAWKAIPYLEKFEQWQSSLPERVWIEDYYRKYLRPRELYGATQFLPMLEGGKKTHQRRQYETYQQYYMASEYQGSEASSSAIDIRANGTDIDQMLFPITMYADSYIRVAAGSGATPNVRVRARRGQTYNITLPVSGTANDMTTYFYLAHYITSLGNIHMLKPKKVDISQAYRIREFSMGSLDEGYSNTNLEEVFFTNNRMLEKLEAQNCPSITNALDLTAATNLKYLDTRGSGFSGITLVENAPVETLYLNDPATLSFSNLKKVANFSIGYDNLNTLFIDNIDNSPGLNSKTLIDNQHNGSLTYNLQNVQWRITDSNEVDDSSISILEKILTPGNTPFKGMGRIDKTLALSGTLTISADAYSGSHSLDLYNKYAIQSATNFPNLDIVFESDTAKLFNVSIVDGNNNVIWTKKSGKFYTITSDFLSSGPMGAFNLIKAITKENTVANTFTFSGTWEMRNANTDALIATIDRRSDDDKNPYYSNTINTDIVIIPIFNEAPRTYQVEFLNDSEVLASGTYTYGTKINTIIPNILPYKDDSALAKDKTYAFLGYSLVATAKNALIFSDDYVVNADLTYYAIFTDEIDVHDSKNIHTEFFDFINASYGEDGTTAYNLSGYEIRPKAGVRLRGKVTIPASYNNTPIVSIGGFGTDNSGTNQTGITGIFFETGTQIRSLSAFAFIGLTNLIYFDMPDSLRRIGRSALQGTMLKLGATKDDTTYRFGKNIVRVDALGLVNCLGPDCEFLYVGSNIKEINAGGNFSIGNFNNATNLKRVYFGSPEEACNLDFAAIESENNIVFILQGAYNPMFESVTYYVKNEAIASQINNNSTLQGLLLNFNTSGAQTSPTLTVLATGGA